MEETKNFRVPLKDADGISQDVALPVEYHQRFEGRRVFDDELFAQFNGCELVRISHICDDGFSVIGEEINSFNNSQNHLIAIEVQVCGYHLWPEYETVFERNLYRIINYADGIKHKGQRSDLSLRFSKKAVERGFTLKTLAHLIYSGLKSEFKDIADLVNVRIISDPLKAKSFCQGAEAVYKVRENRVKGLRDSEVEAFYSCTICQSNSPHHVCIIAPERTGACGSYDYLGAKASVALNPFGPNTMVLKGLPEGTRPGQWEGINDFVYEASGGKLEEMNIYSIVDNPPPFSDCMECISALIPSINGVVVFDRRYDGMTPIGLNFADMQDCIHKGASVTGLMGHARINIIQGAYLKHEGGIKRIIWMPSILKKDLADEFNELAAALGEPGLLDKIADETITVTEEETVVYNRQKNHPFFKMPPVI
ncbi:MAG: hypothetical protein FWF37_03770 [Chloroflexi bacterium]|nr:hypothetical protein [Chloroflexota bacterium]